MEISDHLLQEIYEVLSGSTETELKFLEATTEQRVWRTQETVFLNLKCYLDPA